MTLTSPLAHQFTSTLKLFYHTGAFYNLKGAYHHPLNLVNLLNPLNPHARKGVSKKAAATPLLFSVFQCSNDFIDVFYVILIAPFFHFVHDAFHGGGVGEVSGAYLYGIRAGYHEFDGVFAGHNAA